MSIDTQKPEHSPIGASAMYRWMACPGSVKLGEGLPELPTSKYAAEGTVAHTLGEQFISRVLSSSIAEATEELEDEIGRSYVEDDWEIEVTDGMVEAVKVFTQCVIDIVEYFPLAWHPDYVMVERSFHMPHIHEDAYGKCDVAIYAPMHSLTILDYKHGKGHIVEVVDNLQLLFYALGAYHALRKNGYVDVPLIRAIVVQPRGVHLHGPVREWTFPLERLLAFEKTLVDAIGRVYGANPEFAAGDHCKWCKARAVCPALRGHLSEKTALAFDRFDSGSISCPKPNSLKPEQLATMLENADLLQEFLKGVRATATGYAAKGVQIPGYKMVRTHGNRRWKSEKDVQKAFCLEFDEQMYNKKLKSPAQMEKLLGKTRLSELEPYWEKPDKGETLVAINDSRAAVPVGGQAAFDKYED